MTFVAFISLGMPDGLLDIANPRIRASFDIGPDVFSLIFLTGLTGYALSSFFAGQLVAHLGIWLLLAGSCFMTASALIGYALSPGWGWFVALGLFGGAGAGAIDTGLNTYVATRHGPRIMFWLHAFFGLGVTGGTWVMSAVVNSDHSWRLGYAAVGSLQVTLGLVFLITRARWNPPASAQPQAVSKPPGTPIRATLRMPVVWLGIAIFFLYTGIEITAGRWSSSLFIDARTIKSATAGLWVSAYWGTFTVGRVVAGFIGRLLSPVNFMRLSMAGATASALLLVLDPVAWSGGLALAVFGFSLAPVFPLLVSITPGRVGADHVANTIGFQIAAAAIGGSLLPGLTGVLARQISFEVMPVLLLGVALAILMLNEITERGARARAAMRAAAAPGAAD